MQTQEWTTFELPIEPRDDEIDRLEGRLAAATERAERAEAAAARSLKTAVTLAGRIERKTLQAYDKGFEAGVAFAVADADRRAEPRRRVVERDARGQIVAVVDERGS